MTHIHEFCTCTENSIEKAMLDFLHTANFDIADMLSIGNDGANAMTGRKSGIAVHLQRLNPNLISVHCIAHCLALAIIIYSMPSSEILSTEILSTFIITQLCCKRD